MGVSVGMDAGVGGSVDEKFIGEPLIAEAG